MESKVVEDIRYKDILYVSVLYSFGVRVRIRFKVQELASVLSSERLRRLISETFEYITFLDGYMQVKLRRHDYAIRQFDMIQRCMIV